MNKNQRLLYRNKNLIKGNTLNYNAGLQDEYYKSILILVNKMTAKTTYELSKLFSSNTSKSFMYKQDKLSAVDEEDSDKSISSQARILLNYLMNTFLSLFNKKSKILANDMLKNSEKISTINLNFSFNKMKDGLELKKGITASMNPDVAKSIIEENVNYITSLPEKYFTDVSGAVMRSISEGGQGISSLIPDIEEILNNSLKNSQGKLGKYNKSVRKRAHTIAYDQTRKAYTAINKQRLMKAGIKKFEWIHSYGGRYPRHSHIKIDGEIFSFENLTSEQAAFGVPPEDRGLPGFPINCRCSMKPVLDFEGNDDDIDN